MVAFSDGARAFGTLSKDGLLDLGGYRSAAGTEISARMWQLAIDAGLFRVTGRVR